MDKADVSERSEEAEVGRLSRREWELSEKVIELEKALASRNERDAIREMEIRSLRSELELQTAYGSALEEQKNAYGSALEEQKTAYSSALEEQKTAYRSALQQQKASFEQLLRERMQHIEWLRSHLDQLVSIPAIAPVLSEQDARAALLAERQRISYRVVERLLRYRLLFGPVRDKLRSGSPRRARSDPPA
jgi:hypothetical protein